jgi:hypothetical protein
VITIVWLKRSIIDVSVPSLIENRIINDITNQQINMIRTFFDNIVFKFRVIFPFVQFLTAIYNFCLNIKNLGFIKNIHPR